jgi:hypothetical protein
VANKEYKRYASFGPGGFNCAAPGRVRKATLRRAKRIERAKMRRQLEKESK